MPRVPGLLVLVAVVAAVSASAVHATGAASDPRVCRNLHTHVLLPPRDCAYATATLYFRQHMGDLFHLKHIYQGSTHCKTAGDILRYVCTFHSPSEIGIARVSLGTKPLWKRSVTFRSFRCPVVRPGCPKQ